MTVRKMTTGYTGMFVSHSKIFLRQRSKEDHSRLCAIQPIHKNNLQDRAVALQVPELPLQHALNKVCNTTKEVHNATRIQAHARK